MRRIVFSALFAAFALIATASVTPALAHDDAGIVAASQADNDRDKDARSEAAQLTDELKSPRPARPSCRRSRRPSRARPSVAAHLLNRLAADQPGRRPRPRADPGRARRPPRQPPVRRRGARHGRRRAPGPPPRLRGRPQRVRDRSSSRAARRPRSSSAHRSARRSPATTSSPSGVALAGDQTVVTDQMVVIQSAASVGTDRQPAHRHHPGDGARRRRAPATPTRPTPPASSSTPRPAPRAHARSTSKPRTGRPPIVGANGTAGSASDVFGPFAIAATDCDTTNIRNQAFAAADADARLQRLRSDRPLDRQPGLRRRRRHDPDADRRHLRRQQPAALDLLGLQQRARRHDAQRQDRRRRPPRVRPQPRRLARQLARMRLHRRSAAAPAPATSTATRQTSWAAPAATAT